MITQEDIRNLLAIRLKAEPSGPTNPPREAYRKWIKTRRGRFTTETCAKALGVEMRTASTVLSILRRAGFIRKAEQRWKTGYWERV